MFTAEEAYRLDLHGYLILRDALPREPLLALAKEIAALDDLGPEDLPHSIPVWTPVIDEYRVLNVLDPCPSALAFIDHEAILARADKFMDAPYRLVEAYTITRRKGIGLYLHNIPEPLSSYRVVDGVPRISFLKVNVALTDCGDADGPFCVIEGSHKLGVRFPYSHLPADWEYPPHDRDVLTLMQGHEKGKREVRWQEIPGYREIPLRVGDIVLFTESLIHGACAVRSDVPRRALYLGYGPYSCANWHGVNYSKTLIESATERQRLLLQGPFVGFRYESAPEGIAPGVDVFPYHPNSEKRPKADATKKPAGRPGRKPSRS